MLDSLNEIQKDALREMSSVGAGNAATALSQMIKKTVTIKVPEVNFTTIDDATHAGCSPETVVSAVCMKVLGEIEGIMLISFGMAGATCLSDILLGKERGQKPVHIIDEMGISALKEISSILGGAYLNAISKMFGMRLTMSLPSFSEDMAGALIENVLAETSKDADYAIVVNTELKIVDEKIMARFFFMPDNNSLNKVLCAMGAGTA